MSLLRGEPAPQRTSLRRAYLPLNLAAALVVAAVAALAWWVARTRRDMGPTLMGLLALTMLAALQVVDLGPTMLRAFAPDLALILAAVVVVLRLPAAWRVGAWAGRATMRGKATALQ